MTKQQYKRKFERRAVYDQDVSHVLLKHADETYKTNLYDISPMGAGLFLPQPDEGHAIPKVGSKIALHFGGAQKKEVNALVCHVSPLVKNSKKGLKIGVHFLIEESHDVQHLDEYRRRGKLWILPDLFRPLAYTQDQVFFDEHIHFQIIGYSADELIIRTSKSNKSILPNQKVLLRLLLPAQADDNFFVRIVRVDNHNFDEKSYTLLAKWIKPTRDQQESLAEFLFLACSGTTMKDLVDSGWPALSIRRALRLRYAHDETEFTRVLQLRLKAAQSDGRWQDTKDERKMIDPFDIHSRHIMCIAGERVVASGRLVFNDGEQRKSEHVGYGLKLPDWLWKGGFVEVSRLCTHPDYRGSDVFLFMLEHLGRIVYASGNAYMLVNCVDALVPIYQRFGAKNLKIRFDSPFMQGRKLNLLYFDCHMLSMGLGVNPLYYPLFLKRAGRHLDRQNLLKHNQFEKSIRSIMGLLEPLALKLEKRKRRQKVSSKVGGEQRKKSRKRSAA